MEDEWNSSLPHHSKVWPLLAKSVACIRSLDCLRADEITGLVDFKNQPAREACDYVVD